MKALASVLAATLAATHLAIGLAVLAVGQPHEDAFILFKYAANVARGLGVVYYPGGPHAEGATDFLWMLAIAGARFAGVDVALAAAGLNALGFFLAVALFSVALFGGARVMGSRAWPFVVAVALLLFAPPAVAGYLGFSAMLYSAVALSLVHVYLAGTRRAVLALPAIGLVLALLRPDGVILAAPFAVLGLASARRGAFVARYLAVGAVAALVGAAYFVWRWSYFGLFLPLPLYVKSHYAGRLPGLDEMIGWLVSSVLPLALPLLVAAVTLGPVGWTRAELRARALALVPFGLHSVALLFGVPAQNVANRFQAPTTLALLYLVLSSIAAREERPARARLRHAWLAAFVVAYVPLFVIAQKGLEDATAPSYVDAFARALGELATRDARIATTEAGRLAYFSDAKTVDLVGLDTRETALRPPTRALLDDLAPDLVMLHPAGTMDERCLTGDAAAKVIPIRAPLARCVASWAAGFVRDDLPPYDDLRESNILVAPLATAAWLDERPGEYALFAARFESRFAHYHVFAIREAYARRAEVLRALEASEARGSGGSYLTGRRSPRAAP